MGLDDPCRGFTSINEGEDNCNDLALLAKHGSKILMFSGIFFFDTLIWSYLTALLGHEVVSKRMKQHHTALRVQACSMVEQCCMLVMFDLSEALLSVHRCCLSLHCWKSVCTINMVISPSFPFVLVLLALMGFALCTFSLFSYLCLCRSKDWTTNIHPSPLNCHLILTTLACKESVIVLLEKTP